jgi:3-methyladenine DNA glycosylase AlkD
MTRTRTHPLVAAIRAALAEAADPARAPAMQAYMKSAMPFWGVANPAQRAIWRRVFAAHPLDTHEVWTRVALDLWRGAAYREERYAAIGLTDLPRYRSYRTFDAVPLFEEMVVTGAWWDLVDPVATHHLGDVLAAEPVKAARLMRRWATDADLWKRRAAILCQIGRKAHTDLPLLYDCLEPNLADPAFFIRKAIGWALRQYARTDAAEVRRYVRAHRARLSPLSSREALKHIG